jgi:hypothetical protein
LKELQYSSIKQVRWRESNISLAVVTSQQYRSSTRVDWQTKKKKGIRRINLTVLFDQVTVKPCCPRGRGPAAPVRTCMRENNSDGLPFPCAWVSGRRRRPHHRATPRSRVSFPERRKRCPVPARPGRPGDRHPGLVGSPAQKRRSSVGALLACPALRSGGGGAHLSPLFRFARPVFLATVVMGRRFVYYAQHVVRPSRITKPRPLCLEERGAKECVQSV